MADSEDNDPDRLNRDLTRRGERLAEAMDEVETLFLAVANDFALPLGAVERNAVAIGAGRQEPDIATTQAVQEIRDCVAIMQEMLSDLRRLGALSAEPMQHESVEMAALARAAWAEVADRGEVAFSLGELPRARGHRGMLALVWKYLLSAAASRSAGNKSPRVEVSGGGSGETAIYCVTDNGTGLSLDYTGNVSYALDQIRKQSDHPGIAVGLAIVQRIVTRHHGSLWAEARRDKGALMQFSLPIAKVQPDAK